MSGEVLNDKHVVGRKPHYCTFCGRVIPSGERQRAVAVVGDDGMETQRECTQCEVLLAVIYAHDPDLRYEEYWDVGEYIADNSQVGSALVAAWRRRWDRITPDDARELALACFPPRASR